MSLCAGHLRRGAAGSAALGASWPRVMPRNWGPVVPLPEPLPVGLGQTPVELVPWHSMGTG